MSNAKAPQPAPDGPKPPASPAPPPKPERLRPVMVTTPPFFFGFGKPTQLADRKHPMEFNQTNQNTGNVNNTIEPSEGPALMIVPREPLSEIQRARFTIQF